jgi:predicted Zn-dependent protease
LALCPKVQAVPGGKRRLRFALACLGLLTAIGSGIYLAIPGLSRLIAQRIPLAKERLGGGQLQVRILRDPMPNAFALPGGIILVTDKLLADAESPDEVAGVLAHEIEHIAQRHVLAGVVRDTILTGLWSLTVGDYAGLLVLDPSTAYRIANLEFSREDEAAADAGALARLRRARIRQDGLASFFERLGKRYGGDTLPKWLSTHPSNRERVRVLRRAAPVADARPALSAADFELLQRGCDGAEGGR